MEKEDEFEFAKKSAYVLEKILREIPEKTPEEIFGLRKEDRYEITNKLIEIYYNETKISDAVNKVKEISKDEREISYMLFTLLNVIIADLLWRCRK